MEVKNLNINDLVPSQIIEFIDRLKDALEIMKTKKETISKVALYERGQIECPHCHQKHSVKDGHTKTGIQTYKCKDCGKRFNALTDTIFNGTKLTYEQIEIFLQCFMDKISLRKTAKRMGVDKNTVHLLRLKLLNALELNRKEVKLSGEIESDEIYKSINLKGTKPKNMPRASKPRTSNGTATRGISSHKVCIASAIDEKDNCFFEIVGTGPITCAMVEKSLKPKLVNVKKLITDCKSSYEKIADDNKWNLKQVKANCYTDNEGNNLANINSLHSGLSIFLGNFRGVSTKHLQGYLDWYVYDKCLNYLLEENIQKETLLKRTMKNSAIIKTSNMYDNYSGLNFAEIYADYNYVPSRTN